MTPNGRSEMQDGKRKSTGKQMCISFLNDLTKIDNVEEQDRIKIFDKDFINLERL